MEKDRTIYKCKHQNNLILNDFTGLYYNLSRLWPHATKYLDVNGSLEQKNGSLGI